MIKIIRQPINVFPNDTVIDLRNDMDFSFTFQGDKLDEYIIDAGGFCNKQELFKVTLDKPIYNGETTKYTLTKSNQPWKGYQNSYNEKWWYLYFCLSDFKNNIKNYVNLYDIKLTDTLLSFAEYSKTSNTTEIVVKCNNSNPQCFGHDNSNLRANGNLYLYWYDENSPDDIIANDVKKITNISKGEIVYKEEVVEPKKGTENTGNENIEGGTTTEKVFDYFKFTITIESAFDFDIHLYDCFKMCRDVVKSPPYYYYGHKQPTLTTYLYTSDTEKTSESGYVLNSRKCSFEAEVNTYQQNIKYHQFDIYKGNIVTTVNESNEETETVEWDENSELIYSTGKIYSSNTKFSYDGFVGKKTGYIVQLTIMTDKNVLVKSTGQTFFVEYTTPNNELAPNLEIDYEKQAINVSWLENRQSFPTLIGNADFKQDFPFINSNCLQTGENTTLTYNNLNGNELIIDEDNATIMFKVNLRRLLEPFKAGKNEESLIGTTWHEDGTTQRRITEKAVEIFSIDLENCKYDNVNNDKYNRISLSFHEFYDYNSNGNYEVNNCFYINYHTVNTTSSLSVQVIPSYDESGNDKCYLTGYDVKNDWFLFVIKAPWFSNEYDVEPILNARVYPMNYQVTWEEFNKANPTWNEFNDKVQSWDRFNETNLFK